jgi:ABC-type Fe3+ transport system permease subunit
VAAAPAATATVPHPLAATRPRTGTKPRRRRITPLNLIGWLFLAFMLAFTLVPMAWMVSTSIKTEFASIEQPPAWIPAEPTLEQYTRLLSPTEETGKTFLRYLRNSVWVSTATTALGLIVAVPAAYAFSRSTSPAATPSSFRSGPQHVPGRRLPHPPLHPDALSPPLRHPVGVDPDLPDLRPAPLDLAAQGVL